MDEWGATIACIYSGVLKLSFLSTPARVYRGVKETDLELPPHFLEVEEGKFAGACAGLDAGRPSPPLAKFPTGSLSRDPRAQAA